MNTEINYVLAHFIKVVDAQRLNEEQLYESLKDNFNELKLPEREVKMQ